MTQLVGRRNALKIGGGAALAAVAPALVRAQSSGRVVIVGAGFGGATCARYLRQFAPSLDVTLVEQHETFVTCPFSNAVLSGLNGIDAITQSLDGLRDAGVTVVTVGAAAIDPDGRTVRLAGGDTLPYDRLVLSPGIDFKWDEIEGYDAEAAEIMPHAWKAGPQTLLLRRQLEAMEDGGVFAMAVPANPFRCPPGPYERASLVAHYFKSQKPRSKVLLLDAKDAFSKQGLFQEAWAELYPGLIEWVPFAENGNLLSVDPTTNTMVTEFATHSADVANIIPPQRAAAIAIDAGLGGGGDWCAVDQATFESLEIPGIHVLGDASIAGAMPKSGFSAGSQGKVCALAIAALQSDGAPPDPSYANTCYSLVAPDYGISVAAVYRLGGDGAISAVEGSGGVSPSGASTEFRRREADYARGWYASMMAEMYG